MSILRHFVTIALVACCFVGAGPVNTAHSSTLTYTLTGGKISGTLNGVPFSDKSFTMTADADPANFLSISTEFLGAIRDDHHDARRHRPVPNYAGIVWSFVL
jgi:hypothetical protein